MRNRLVEVVTKMSCRDTGRGPLAVRVDVRDSVVTVELRGALTTLELRLIQFGRADLVEEIRAVYRQGMLEEWRTVFQQEFGIFVKAVDGRLDCANDIRWLEFHI